MNEMGALSYLFILNKKYIFCMPVILCRMDRKNQGSPRGRALDDRLRMEMIAEEVQPHGLPLIGMYRHCRHHGHVPRFFAPLRMTVPAGNSRLMSHICLSHGLRRPPPDGRIPPFHKRAKNIPYPAGIQRSRIGVVSHFRRSEGGQRYGR